jgi:hypothetical protein
MSRRNSVAVRVVIDRNEEPNRRGNNEKQQRHPSEEHAETKFVSVCDLGGLIHGS